MAEKRFDTRILLKYDSLSNWNSSSLVLKAGEVAIATVPTSEAVQKQDGIITPPAAIVFKVGDGEHTFKDLPLVSGLAADVYGWAKKDEGEFISWLKEKNEFATKTIFDNLDAKVSGIDAAYKAADETLRGLIDTITGGSGDVEGLGSLATKITDLETVLASFIVKDDEGHVATDAVKAAIDAVSSAVSAVETKVANLEADKAAKDVKIASIESSIADIQSDISDNAAAIGAINEVLGEIPEGNSIVEMLEEVSETANTALTNAVAGINNEVAGVKSRVDAIEESIEVINGSGEGSIKKAAADVVAKIVADADEDFDTLKEIADWIANDKEGAAALQNTVAEHTTKLTGFDSKVAGLEAKDITLASDIADLQTQINNIVGGEGAAGSLVSLESRVGANEQAIIALQSEDTRLAGLIGTNTGAIAALQAKDTELAGLVSSNADAIVAEKERAEEAEATLLGLIEAEASRADTAEKANKTLIETLSAKVEGLHKVSSTGLINDLGQDGEIIFDCGSSASR